MRAVIVWTALTACPLLTACGANDSSASCRSDGVLLLSWTIDHRPPTADQGCQGIASLYLQLQSACGDLTIEPIPCINGPRWQYNGMPEGPAQLTLLALDRTNNVLGQALLDLQLTPSPSTPAPLDITLAPPP